MQAPVGLVTDFGLDDPYVGQVRVVLTTLLPGVPVIDISHAVPAHCVSAGALFLASSLPFFPYGSLLLAVVDPGVGTDRPVLCAIGQTSSRVLLGPDNGIVSLAARRMASEESVAWYRLPADPAGIDWHRAFAGSGTLPYSPSTTFHGRDYFPYLVERIRAGCLPVEAVSCSPPSLPCWAQAEQLPDGYRITVLHIDRFGNAIVNLEQGQQLDGTWMLAISPDQSNGSSASIPSHGLSVVSVYSEIPGGQAALIRGSQGYWEIAAREQSATSLLSLAPGDRLRLMRSAHA